MSHSAVYEDAMLDPILRDLAEHAAQAIRACPARSADVGDSARHVETVAIRDAFDTMIDEAIDRA
jgi:hypothetical protein